MTLLALEMHLMAVAGAVRRLVHVPRHFGRPASASSASVRSIGCPLGAFYHHLKSLTRECEET